MEAKVSYANVDILIAPTHTEGVTAFICCNKETESRASIWSDDFHGNCCRTVFGLTYYSHNQTEYNLYLAHVKSKGLRIWHGAL